jgi:hypothetical protein
VANKPGTPRRARISRHTIVQGMPDVPADLWWTNLRAFVFLHARLRVRFAHRHSLCPLIGAKLRDELGRHLRRGNADARRNNARHSGARESVSYDVQLHIGESISPSIPAA